MATTKGGIVAARQNQMQAQGGARKSMQALVQSMMPQIQKALPSVLTGERFARMVLTALSSTPQLSECTPQSFMGAMMQAAQLGVEPNTPLGQAYLIPYRNHGRLECQFQLKDRGRVTMYYAIWHTKAGGYGFEVMSVEDIQKHAKAYSQSYSSNYSPWTKNFDAMAKKTVLKQALKYAPLKTEFVRGVSADGTVKSFTKDTGDILDAPDENTYDAEAETVEAPQDEPAVDKETGEILEKPKEAAEGNLL